MIHHHLTGRPAPDEAYFDPRLVVAVCPRDHIAEHQALRRLGLDWPAPGRDPLVHRLVRLGAFANRTADAGRGLVLSASATRGLAELILESARVLDVHRGAAS